MAARTNGIGVLSLGFAVQGLGFRVGLGLRDYYRWVIMGSKMEKKMDS